MNECYCLYYIHFYAIGKQAKGNKKRNKKGPLVLKKKEEEEEEDEGLFPLAEEELKNCLY